MNLPAFAVRFEQLTGHAPFGWQTRLYGRLLTGDIPPACDIPTGLGKTSVVALWLLALAAQPERLSRRLVYVVNRRTVVDQTTAEIERLRKNLRDKPELASLKASLEALCTPGIPRDTPLAVSTLRGQFADNREWSSDPCRPAVIVGTVDLIGSRLLFSGYRAGFKTRPLQAALLGQDALIAHDEAHLEPAFQKLLLAVEREQRVTQEDRPIKVIALSATTRRQESAAVAALVPDDSPSFRLTDEERAEPGVVKRLAAVKQLRLHPLDDPKRLPEELAKLALDHRPSSAAVLVFARSVETVEKVAGLLTKEKLVGPDHVRTLTGTMRGKERDGLAEDAVFRRFLPPSDTNNPATQAPGTVYLVCTSAGEVGVNISADHLVCDLTTYESMAQRFGRVNRFGKRVDTVVDVVHPTAFKEPDETPLRHTLALLESLPGTVNSAALSTLPENEREAAFSPLPGMLDTSGILFDAWAMTSIKEPLPGRPPVEPYLHGLNDPDAPTTELVWREEVGVIVGDLQQEHDPDDLFAAYPVKPHEILRLPADRAWKQLQKIALRHPDEPVWLVNGENPLEFLRLRDFLDKRKDKTFVESRQLLFPPAVGGLDKGFFDGDSEKASDVADWSGVSNPPARRLRTWDDEKASEMLEAGMQVVRKLEFNTGSDENGSGKAETDATEAVDQPTNDTKTWWWLELPLAAAGETSAYARAAVELGVHNRDVERAVLGFAKGLNLSADLTAALQVAGRFHDAGKARRQWQQSIGNFGTKKLLAKSDGRRKMPPSYGFDYRHEFGSLLDLANAPEFQSLTEDMRDLTLHLVAAHHGRARPHFTSEEALDPERGRTAADTLAAETPRRFARLQRRYGRWGLAFLESLLRAADYAASANPSATLADPKP